MNKNMVYGANEATSLTDKVADFTKGKNIHFGSGAFKELTVVAIATAPKSDAKVRFVYDATGDSGMVFVGNQLASSKILDITTNKVLKKNFDPNTGEYLDSTYTAANKVTVTWFGTLEDPDDHLTVKTKVWTTEFDVIDTKTVENMIAKASADLKASVDDLKTKHETDVLRLDASVSGIETLLKSDVVSEAKNGAITVTPTKDANEYQTYTVGVKVDDKTVKVVEDKLAVATYAIKRVADADMTIDASTGEKTYAAEYKLMMTAPGKKDAIQVGDTINIAKDFLVSAAHVCSFNYVAKNGDKIVYGKDADQWGQTSTINRGDVVTSKAMLPWSNNQDGSWEQARLGFGIKYGHSYLHLVMNTKPSNTESAKTSDVYLDFTQIFETFKGDDKFIKVENGTVSLLPDTVTGYVDEKLKITGTFASLKAEDTSIGGRLDTLDKEVAVIQASYVKDASLKVPKANNEQFNTLTLTTSKDGKEEAVTVDVANDTFYTGLNTALDQLQENDKYLAGLLTWEEL